jgi:hypothetical protein
MWHRSTFRPLVALSLASVVGCATGSEPGTTAPSTTSAEFARSLGGAPAVFVLDRVEDQAAAPIVTFDHTCQGQRYQHRIFDTITVWPSGRAQRAFTFESLTNGVVRDASHLRFVGSWSVLTRRDYYYFSERPSLVLNVASSGERASSMEMLVRIADEGTLTTLQAVGGSCPGSANDAREVEAAYSRR